MRNFVFAKIPTTDAADDVCTDSGFLSNISVIKIEYRTVKQVPAVKPKEGEKKAPTKKKTPAATTSKTTYRDPLATSEDRFLDEQTDKGKFALNAGYVNFSLSFHDFDLD